MIIGLVNSQWNQQTLDMEKFKETKESLDPWSKIMRTCSLVDNKKLTQSFNA